MVSPSRLRDIGHGGLGFFSSQPLEPGEIYHFFFTDLGYEEPVRGEVVWSKARVEEGQDGYMGGVRFLEEGIYTHARLVVNVCHLEFYRRDQRERHGRQLDYPEAVAEWKQKYRFTATN